MSACFADGQQHIHPFEGPNPCNFKHNMKQVSDYNENYYLMQLIMLVFQCTTHLLAMLVGPLPSNPLTEHHHHVSHFLCNSTYDQKSAYVVRMLCPPSMLASSGPTFHPYTTTHAHHFPSKSSSHPHPPQLPLTFVSRTSNCTIVFHHANHIL